MLVEVGKVSDLCNSIVRYERFVGKSHVYFIGILIRLLL